MPRFPGTLALLATLTLASTSAAQFAGPLNGSSQSQRPLAGAPLRPAVPHPTATGIWTLANSPYVLTDDVYVIHLTIEAGVTVLARPGVEIVVLGELIARGTQSAPILFNNAGAQGQWDGLRFLSASGSSTLEYCEIEGSQSSGIEILNSTVYLRDCEIHDNQ